MNTEEQNQAARAQAAERVKAEERLQTSMARIARKIVVLSGKGGVGKSTVAANLSAALALSHKTGLLDTDLHGPSIPRLMGLVGQFADTDDSRILPLEAAGVQVMSMGLLLRDRSEALVWRGPVKLSAIRQLLGDVAWGDLDYLVVDCPPGTGDEPLTVAQSVGSPAAAVIVTTPQALAVDDARRCVTFCRQVNLPIAGIVENMSGFACPDCHSVYNLFGSGGGEKLAAEMDVPFLGAIPIDPAVMSGEDAGRPFASLDATSPAGQAFLKIVAQIEGACSKPDHDCCGRPHEPGVPHQCTCH
jgi:ATP-binding protein involved in chromosome partitioning